MAQFIDAPDFKSEQEEAEWWASEDGQAKVLAAFEEAAKDGTLRYIPPKARDKTPTTTIRLDPNDIELAKLQAEKRGLRYQTYLKSIIHQALLQEAGKP